MEKQVEAGNFLFRANVFITGVGKVSRTDNVALLALAQMKFVEEE